MREPVIVHSGPRSVAIAEQAGGIALPADRWPASVQWPVAGLDVAVLEHGEVDDARIGLLVVSLFRAGARSVNLWRLGLIGRAYRCVYISPELIDLGVAA